MKRINDLFFNVNITWKRVIVFSILVAIYTAFTLVTPYINKTSLSNIGVYIESWVLFALIIIMNAKSPVEAALKTFVFFLISQPLIYLLQVPFSYLGWNIFMFYKQWFIITLLTLPGGFIAWYVKKDNILSALILSVATMFICFQGVDFLHSVIFHFPNNLLSCLFCFGLIYLFVFTLLKKKTNRMITLSLTLFALIVSFIYFFR